MCGIVGYIGTKRVEPILLDGLHRLEYRGYDSAGMAFLKNNEFLVIRAKGKLINLTEKALDYKSDATLGIGHTRWATHGRPSENNAHPHYSKDVVLVHNGIIENYAPLKRDLATQGFEFSSETDTEVICHLIQSFLNQGENFTLAFQKALEKMQGAFALVALFRKDPHHIYVAKTGSPLVIGIGEGENFVASDIPALLSHTRQVVFLEDGEMGVISRSGFEISDLKGHPIQKKIHEVQWSIAQAEKDGYKHFMLKEIMEQPRVLSDTILGRVDRKTKQVTFEGVDDFLKKFSNISNAKVHIVACGTSWHAGLLGKYWLESFARIPTQVDLASEFRYRKPIIDEQTLVIPISQSGETADTLAALIESKKQGASVLSICNVMDASIPRKSDATLYTNAGPEIGVASTKAFTTQLSVLFLLALKLAALRDALPQAEIASRLEALLHLPIVCKKFLKSLKPQMMALTEQIYRKDHCYFLGRGTQFPIVLEGALKLKEISYIHAEAYAGGEMKHGPIALIEEQVPVFAVAVKDALYEKMCANIEEVSARGAQIFVLHSEGDAELKKKYPYRIEIPDTHFDLLPFLTILPFQLLAYHVADHKGTDVDQPRNLAKSVTVE